MRRSRDKQNDDTPRRILSRIKSRALKENIPFNLMVEDIVVPSHCPILGSPIVDRARGGHAHSPSVDRIIPKLGYVRGNIGIISKRANSLKSNITIDEVRKLLAYMEGVSNAQEAVPPLPARGANSKVG